LIDIYKTDRFVVRVNKAVL